MAIDYSNFQIRPMMKSDLDQVYAIEIATHVEPWSRGIIHDCIDVGYTCLVMELRGDICAYIITRITVDDAHILNICVKRDKQKQGLAKRLINKIVEIAKSRLVDKVVLEVRETNKPAIKLYEKMGFECVGRRKNYYKTADGHEDSVDYSLKI